MNGCVHRTADNKCTYYSRGDTVSWCDLENGCDSVVPSNYDRIHAMSIEELAQAFANVNCLEESCPCDTKICNSLPYGCYIAWMKWLEERAEVEDDRE